MSADSPRIFVPPPLVIFGTLVIGLGLDGRLQSMAKPVFIPLLFGGVIVCLGVALIIAALGLFRLSRTRPEPWQPASTLVRRGVYGYTRNPMYLGMLITYVGVAVALQSVSALALLVPVFIIIDRPVVAREETYLARRFGSSYESYRSEVRRWL